MHQHLAGRVEAFLERFRRSRTGVPTLADAVTKLTGIDANEGKRAALDALLTKAHHGKHNAKQLAAAAARHSPSASRLARA